MLEILLGGGGGGGQGGQDLPLPLPPLPPPVSFSLLSPDSRPCSTNLAILLY